MTMFRRIRRMVTGGLMAVGLVLVGAMASPTLRAQLPGYPVGIPQSVQSTLWGYFFGGVWRPATSTTGVGLMTIAATQVPANSTATTMDVLRLNPVVSLGGTAVSLTQFAGLHVFAPTISNNNANSVTRYAGIVVDPPGIAATNNYGLWLKGASAAPGTNSGAGARIDGDIWLAGDNVAFALTSNMTIFGGSSPTIQGNQYAFAANVGTGGTATSITITFGTPYTHTPSCFTQYGAGAGTNQITSPLFISNLTVGSIQIRVNTAWSAATTIYGGCFGW